MGVFGDFEHEYGPPEDRIPPSAESLLQYVGVLPDELLEQWRQDAWCSYGHGLLWLSDPEQVADVMEEWVEVIGPGRPVVFLRTAFAHLYFWREGSVYSLDVHRGSLSEVTKRIHRIFTLLCDPEIKERTLRASLYASARERLGPPQQDECYAFEPALALGGPGTVETIRRVKLREHLAILAQIHQR
jgi:hypothetical protein